MLLIKPLRRNLQLTLRTEYVSLFYTTAFPFHNRLGLTEECDEFRCGDDLTEAGGGAVDV